MLGVAIYLFIFTESANAFNIGFLVIAVILGAVSLISYRCRKNLDLLTAYLIFLGVIFLGQLILTILLLANKNKMLEWALSLTPESSESLEELANKIDKHYESVVISLWVFCGITVSNLS